MTRWRIYPLATGAVLWSTWLLGAWSSGSVGRQAALAAAVVMAAYVAVFWWLWRRAGRLREYPIEAAAAAFASPALYAAMMRTAALVAPESALHPPLSLRGLAQVLVGATDMALTLYVAASAVVAAIGIAVWRTAPRREIRWSAALLTLVLISPIVRESDLVILMPAFVLLADWILEAGGEPARRLIAGCLCALYLAPVAAPIDVEFRVPVIVGAMAAIVVTLGFTALESSATRAARGLSPS